MTGSLIIGILMLSISALAGYNTANGYGVGKNALKGLLDNENYTSETTYSLELDGVLLSESKSLQLYDRNGDVRLNEEGVDFNSAAFCGYLDRDTTNIRKIWMQDGSQIYYDDYNGDTETRVYENSYDWNNGVGGSFDVINQNDNDRKTIDKYIRFAELVCDTMVGDLKNNIVYVSGGEDSSTYEINLDAVQIPEFVNAGFSAIFAAGYNDNDNLFAVLGEDPTVSNASLIFTVNKDGKLTYANAEGTLSGNGHYATLKLSLKMYDYGTTKPQRVDIETLPNVESYYVNEGGRIGEPVDEETEEYEEIYK